MTLAGRLEIALDPHGLEPSRFGGLQGLVTGGHEPVEFGAGRLESRFGVGRAFIGRGDPFIRGRESGSEVALSTTVPEGDAEGGETAADDQTRKQPEEFSHGAIVTPRIEVSDHLPLEQPPWLTIGH